ncbi:MAG: hypothetical protein WKF87_22535 [Chryseolinea sp.]
MINSKNFDVKIVEGIYTAFGFRDLVERYATTIFNQAGQLPATSFLRFGGGKIACVTWWQWQDDHGKGLAIRSARNLATVLSATEYAFISEAWMRVEELKGRTLDQAMNDQPHFRISEMPDRQECVMICFEAKGKPMDALKFDIVRDANGTGKMTNRTPTNTHGGFVTGIL